MAEKIQYKLDIDDGNSAQTLGSLEDHLESLQDELRNTEIGTKRFNELQNEIQETDARVREFDRQMEGMDTEQLAGQFGDLAMAGGDLAAGFTLITGAGEDAQQTFNEVFGALEAMEGAIRAPIAAMNLYAQRATIMRQVNTALAATQRTLNTVIRNNPYAALATAIGVVAGALGTWYATSEDAEEQQKDLNEETREANELSKKAADRFAEEVTQLETLLVEIENTKEGTNEHKTAVKELDEQYGEYIDSLRNEKGELKEIDEIRDDVIQGLHNEQVAKANSSEISKILSDRVERERNSILQNSIAYNELAPILNRVHELEQEGLDGREIKNRLLEEENDLTEDQRRVIEQNVQTMRSIISERGEENERIEELLESNKELNTTKKEENEETEELTYWQRRQKEATDDLNSSVGDTIPTWEEYTNKLVKANEEQGQTILAHFDTKVAVQDLEDEYKNYIEFLDLTALSQEELAEKTKEAEREKLIAIRDRIARTLMLEEGLTEDQREEWRERLKIVKGQLKNMEDEGEESAKSFGRSWDRILSDNIIEGLEIEDEAMQAAVGESTQIAVETVNNAFDRAMEQRQERIEQQRENEVQAAQDKADREISILEAQLEQEKITEEEFARRKAEIQRQRRMEEYQAKIREWRSEKRMATSEALIQGGVATARAFADYSWPASLAVAALVGAQTATQVAQIQNQQPPPPPEFQRGGLIGGRRHAEGGTLVEAEEGEIILNRNVAANPQMLEIADAMNQSTGGNSLTTDGAQSSGGPSGGSQGPMRAYVVESDISEKQRKQNRRERRSSF